MNDYINTDGEKGGGGWFLEEKFTVFSMLTVIFIERVVYV